MDRTQLAPATAAEPQDPTPLPTLQEMADRMTEMAARLAVMQREVAALRLHFMPPPPPPPPPAPRMPLKYWVRHQIKTALGLHVRLGKLHFPGPAKALRVPRRYHRKPQLADPPLISIVTPSFNQGPFLEQTIRSVLGQEYPRLEYVVQDGGSTDSSAEVLGRYRGRLHHCEMRKDRGQSHAINLGFARTTGEVMAYLNSDDLLLPGALFAVARFFAKNPAVDAVYGHRVLINGAGSEIGRWVVPRHDAEALVWADYVPQETLFWRRRIWEKAGGRIDESFRFAMDWDLLLRFQQAGAKFYRLPRFLGAFRVHDDSKTMTSVNSQGLEEMNRLRRRCHGRDVSYVEIAAALRGYFARHVFCNRMYELGLFRY